MGSFKKRRFYTNDNYGRFNLRKMNYLIFILLIFFTEMIKSSEFPERECCDPIYPPLMLPDPEPLPPALPTTTVSSSSATPTGRSGPNIKTAIAILNCILARQLCFEDPSCSAILEIIPRVCGPVPVSCSTVTVTKCQAALRTLQAFPFFRPTCLCKEPGVDPDCNYFRDFLFDHPCGFVLKKEKDPYPIDALPTCNHALSVCQQERKCIKLFEDFKTHCKVRENKCRMEDRDLCHEAWTNLRLSPMFGCICPNNHMKRRCDKIFSVVNHNPCIGHLPSALDSSYGTATNSIEPLFYPPNHHRNTHDNDNNNDNDNNVNELNIMATSSYPYFLFPPNNAPQSSSSSNNYNYYNRNVPFALPATSSENLKYFYSYNITNTVVDTNTNNNDNNNMNNEKLENTDNVNEAISTNFNNNYNHNLHKTHQYTMHQQVNGTIISAPTPAPIDNKNQARWKPAQHWDAKKRLEMVRNMGMEENYHKLFDENMAKVNTPLIANINSYYPPHFKTALYPYNITTYKDNTVMPSSIDINSTGYISWDKQSGSDETDEIEPEVVHVIHFQSTCHTAMEACREDAVCATSLQPVLQNCDIHRCNRNGCMESLQHFYRSSHEDLSLDIAFCLCRKTPNRHDTCMKAQEKLHPSCAQRAPDLPSPQASNGVQHNSPPACHSLADSCREEPECRTRLEFFEQSCAVDSVTKKCAGKTSTCRMALLGILGTMLRVSCACQGAELQQLYDCLGWQRLLWLNPCVVEAQTDFHVKRLAELGLLTTTTKATTIGITTAKTTTTTTTTTVRTPPSSVVLYRPPTTMPSFEDNYIEEPRPDSVPETLIHINGHGDAAHHHHVNKVNGGSTYENGFMEPNHNKVVVLTSEATVIEITQPPTTTPMTTLPTTTTQATTTVPIRYCVVQRPHQSDQYIPEGKSRRIYLLDDTECSELCTCANGGDTLQLACHALCVPLAPCRTSLAYYSHASPAFQAFRGRCLCYSGRFICMRPPHGEYTLPGGIYLLLGFSSTDEALLRPHTNLGVQDAVRALQQYIVNYVNNQSSCTLQLFNLTEENIILAARIPHDAKTNFIEILQKEKQQCTPILETISHQINTQYTEFSAHRLLSIFKMAEVSVVMPEISIAVTFNEKTTIFRNILLSLFVSFIPIVRWFMSAHHHTRPHHRT